MLDDDEQEFAARLRAAGNNPDNAGYSRLAEDLKDSPLYNTVVGWQGALRSDAVNKAATDSYISGQRRAPASEIVPNPFLPEAQQQKQPAAQEAKPTPQQGQEIPRNPEALGPSGIGINLEEPHAFLQNLGMWTPERAREDVRQRYEEAPASAQKALDAYNAAYKELSDYIVSGQQSGDIAASGATRRQELEGYLEQKRKELVEAQKELVHSREMLEGKSPLPTMAPWKNIVETYSQRLASYLAAGSAKLIGVSGGYLAKGQSYNPAEDPYGSFPGTVAATGTEGTGAAEPHQNVIFRFGTTIDEWAKQHFPADPTRQEEFGTRMADMAAFMTALIGTKGVEKLLERGPNALALAYAARTAETTIATSPSVGHYEAATQAGVPEAQRFGAFLSGSLLAAFPIAGVETTMSRRLVGGTQGMLTAGTTQGAAMAGYSLANDAIAKGFYDPNREIGKDVGPYALVGFLFGYGGKAVRDFVSSRISSPEEMQAFYAAMQDRVNAERAKEGKPFFDWMQGFSRATGETPKLPAPGQEAPRPGGEPPQVATPAPEAPKAPEGGTPAAAAPEQAQTTPPSPQTPSAEVQPAPAVEQQMLPPEKPAAVGTEQPQGEVSSPPKAPAASASQPNTQEARIAKWKDAMRQAYEQETAAGRYRAKAPERMEKEIDNALRSWLNPNAPEDNVGQINGAAARILGIEPTINGIANYLRGADLQTKPTPDATSRMPEHEPVSPGHVPTIHDVHDVLPRRPDGYADMDVLREFTRQQFGKWSVSSLTPEETRATYDHFASARKTEAPAEEPAAEKPQEAPPEAKPPTLLSLAYGDHEAALSTMLESPEPHIKGIASALHDSASEWSVLKAGVEHGIIRPEMDITPNLMNAVNLLSQPREKGAEQVHPDPIVESFVKGFVDTDLALPETQQKLTEVLKDYAAEASKHQVGIDIADKETAWGILDARIRKLREEAQSELHGKGRVSERPVGPGEAEQIGGASAAPSTGRAGEGVREHGGQVPGSELTERERLSEAERSKRGELDKRFTDILARGVPRDRWGAELGLKGRPFAKFLDRHLVQGGLLYLDTNGIIRTTPEARGKTEIDHEREGDGGLLREESGTVPKGELPEVSARPKGEGETRVVSPDAREAGGAHGGTDADRNAIAGAEARTALPREGEEVRGAPAAGGRNREPRPDIGDTQRDLKTLTDAGVENAKEVLKNLEIAGYGIEPDTQKPDKFVKLVRPDGGSSITPNTRVAEIAKTRADQALSGEGPYNSAKQRRAIRETKEVAEQQRIDRSARNYQILETDQIGIGGPKEKVRANIEAIRTLKQIQEEQREATEAEKKILVKYVGWGAFAQELFDTKNYRHAETWAKERAEIQNLLSDVEYKAARESTPNAHYTSADVINGMWDVIQHFGYKRGRAIEPSAGVGHFIGLQPENMRPGTAWTAVELDIVTGDILKALYSGSDVRFGVGYETQRWPDNFFDLAISNVPFGDYVPRDPSYKQRMNIHDYYFVRSLDKIRPGGIVAFITSKGTLDKQNSTVRREIAKRGSFLGAIRLPGGDKGAFKKNAGTEVTADIIFLRKRMDGEPEGDRSWIETKEITTPEGPTEINAYFADHPEMMLGEMHLQGTMRRADEPVLVGSLEGLRERIAQAGKRLMQDAFIEKNEARTIQQQEAEASPEAIKEGAFYLGVGTLYRKIAGVGQEQKIGKEEIKKVSRLIGLRDTMNTLLAKQAIGGMTGRDELRADLNKQYDAFVKAYGPIGRVIRTPIKRFDKAGNQIVQRRVPNFKTFSADPDAYKVLSLETYDEEKDIAAKAAIMSEDVLKPYVEPKIVDAADALIVSLNNTGRVDMDEIARLLNKTPDEAAAALEDKIFIDPNGEEYKQRDDYLSGDVVTKLEQARAAAQTDQRYARNVEALKDVQPTALTRTDIFVPMGAPWVPIEDYIAFAQQELGMRNIQFSVNEQTKKITVAGKPYYSDAANTQFGTNRVPVHKILQAALSSDQIRVNDYDADGKPVLNKEATEEAAMKVQLLKEHFSGDPETGIEGWVWGNEERAQRLEALYNQSFNRLVEKRFDGSHQTLPGIAKSIASIKGVRDFELNPHQKDAIWRIVQTGNTLLHHVVGAGKTYAMIAAGMEQKRLGLVQRPAYVVPNHMLEQFSREFLQAYPNAKLLVADKDSMDVKKRKELAARIASDKWDGIIITHDSFTRIKMSKEAYKDYYDSQIAELEDMIERARAEEGKGSLSVKDMEKRKKRLKERLEKSVNEERKDAGVTFEELGLDQLFVDEAHLFKSLPLMTRFGRVKGIKTDNSQRALDLYIKIRHLEKSKPGRSVVFATGTPISNTIGELYIMQKYLQENALKNYGVDEFDSWASTFGQIASGVEQNVAGKLVDTTRFRRFVNVADLIQIYRQVADIQTADMLNLPRPKLAGGAIKPVLADADEAQIQQFAEHMQRFDALRGKRPGKGENPLSIVTEGRKAAIDMRLLNPDAPFNPTGKVAKLVENVHRIWKEGKDPALTQIVFLDMGVPKAGSEAPKRDVDQGEPVDEDETSAPDDLDFDRGDLASKINLYEDIRQRLVDAGIPRKEIAFIHEAKDDEKKGRLFEDVRAARVRVLIGTRPKMGVGTNVQTKLFAAHHVDPPWRPDQLEQSDGRILRQGNDNPEVEIYRYFTPGSIDSFIWGAVERKARFISQIMAGARGIRIAEDIDDPVPEASEMRALSSGDPRIVEHAELSKKLRELEAQKRNHERTIQDARGKLSRNLIDQEALSNIISAGKEDTTKVKDLSGKNFKVMLSLPHDRNYIERKDTGEALLTHALSMGAQIWGGNQKSHDVGTMSGLIMGMDFKRTSDGIYARALIKSEGSSPYTTMENWFAVNTDTDPVGLIRRYENIVRGIPDVVRANEQSLERLKADQTRYEKLSKQKPFPKQEEFEKTSLRLKQLQAESSNKQPTLTPEVEARAELNVERYEAAYGQKPAIQVRDHMVALEASRENKAKFDAALTDLRDDKNIGRDEMVELARLLGLTMPANEVRAKVFDAIASLTVKNAELSDPGADVTYALSAPHEYVSLSEKLVKAGTAQALDKSINELYHDASLPSTARLYYGRLEQYLNRHFTEAPQRNTIVEGYYRLTGDKAGEGVDIGDLFKAYLDSTRALTEEQKARKQGKASYLKDERSFRRHLYLYGRRTGETFGNEVPHLAAPWLVDEGTDKVYLNPYLPTEDGAKAAVQVMYALSGFGSPLEAVLRSTLKEEGEGPLSKNELKVQDQVANELKRQKQTFAPEISSLWAQRIPGYADLNYLEQKKAQKLWARNKNKNPDIMYALSGFKSPLEAAIEGAQRKQGTGQAWISELNKGHPGLRKEYIEHSGIEQWLSERKGPVSKDTVLSYAREHELDVQEHVAQTPSPRQLRELSEQAVDYIAQKEGIPKIEVLDKYKLYSPYTLIERAEGLGFQGSMGFSHFEAMGFDGGEPGSYREITVEVPEFVGRFREAHHGNKPVIVHVFYDVVRSPNGDRLLRLSQVQSKYAAEGEKKGYAQNIDFKRLAQIEEEQRLLLGIAETGASTKEDIKRFRELIDERASLLKAYKTSGVPASPFQGDYAWQLGIKIAIRNAIRDGVDGIAFPTGEMAEISNTAKPGALTALYDNKIPAFVRRYTREWGGTLTKEYVPDMGGIPTLDDVLERRAEIESWPDPMIEESALSAGDIIEGNEREFFSKYRGRILMALDNGILKMREGEGFREAFGLRAPEADTLFLPDYLREALEDFASSRAPKQVDVLRVTPAMRAVGQQYYALSRFWPWRRSVQPESDIRRMLRQLNEQESSRFAWLDDLPEQPTQQANLGVQSSIRDVIHHIDEAETNAPTWLDRLPEQPSGEAAPTQPQLPPYMVPPEEIAARARTPEQIEADKAAQQRKLAGSSSLPMPDYGPLPEDQTPEAMRERAERSLASEAQPSSDVDVGKVAERLIKDGIYTIDQGHRQETFRIVDPIVQKIAPAGMKVFVLKHIELDDQGKPYALYETSAGDKKSWPDSVANSFSADGFLDGASDSIFLNRVVALGDSEHFIRSVVVHEVADFARAKGIFLPGATLEGGFLRILAHVNRLHFMELPVTQFRSLISDPRPNPEVASLADLYNDLYRDDPQKQAHIDRETVSHAIQLFDALKARRDPRLLDFDPVKRDIEAFLSGDHKNMPIEKAAIPAAERPRMAAAFVPIGTSATATGTAPSAPIKPLKDIIEDLKSSLGLPATQGRLKLAVTGAKTGRRRFFGVKPKVMGQYDLRTGGARYRYASDIETIAHEGGHHIERIFGKDLEALKDANKAELEPMAYPGAADKISEGFAEFFRLFVLDPQAARIGAPKFFKEFEDFLDAHDPQLFGEFDSLRRAQTTQDYRDHLAATETDRAIANLSSRTDSASFDVKKVLYGMGINDTMSGMSAKLWYQYLDRTLPVFKMAQALLNVSDINKVRDAEGRQISLAVHEHPGKLLRSVGDSYKTAQNWFQEGMPNYRHQITLWAARSERTGQDIASFSSEGEARDWLNRTPLSEPVNIEKVTVPSEARSAKFWEALDEAIGKNWTDAGVKKFGAYLESRRAVEEWKSYKSRLAKMANLRGGIDQLKTDITDAKTVFKNDRLKLNRRYTKQTQTEALLADAQRRELRFLRREEDEANYQQFAGASLSEERRNRLAIQRREDRLTQTRALRDQAQTDYEHALQDEENETGYRQRAQGLTPVQRINTNQRIRTIRSQIKDAERRMRDLDALRDDIEDEVDDLLKTGLGHLTEKERATSGGRLTILRGEARKAGEDVQRHKDKLAETELDIDALEQAIEGHQAHVDTLTDTRDEMSKDLEETENGGIQRAPHVAPQDRHEQRIKDFETQNPTFPSASKKVYDFLWQSVIHDWQAGKLSRAQMEYRMQRRDYYVPYERDLSDVAWDRPMLGRGRGFTKDHRFTGSDRPVYNPIETIVDQTFHRAAATHFNDVFKGMAQLSDRAGPGSAAIARRMTQKELIDLDAGGLKRIENELIAQGFDPQDAADLAERISSDFGDMAAFLSWTPENSVGKPLRIPFYENGERGYLEVPDPEWAKAIYDGLGAVSRDMRSIFWNIAVAPSMLIQSTVWSSLAFSTRHALRTMWASWMQTGHVLNPKTWPLISTFRGLYHELGQTDTARFYQELSGSQGGMHRGVMSSASDRLDVLELKRAGIRYDPRFLWPGMAIGGIGGLAVGGLPGMFAGGFLGAAVHKSLPAKGPRDFLLNKLPTSLAQFADTVEVATRLGIFTEAYKTALKYNPSLTRYQAGQEATWAARSIFDGSRKGSRMVAISALVPFMNAHIQHVLSSLEKFWGKHDRGLGISPTKLGATQAVTFAGVSAVAGPLPAVMAAMAAPIGVAKAMQQWETIRLAMRPFFQHAEAGPQSEEQRRATGDAAKMWLNFALFSLMYLAFRYLYSDDEEHEMVSAKLRNQWMPIKIGDTWFKSPNPFQLGVGGAILVAAFDAQFKSDPRLLERTSDALYDTMLPPTMLQVGRLYMDVRTNTDTFRNRPIVPEHYRHLSPQYQFDEFTSKLAKGIGQQTGMSPFLADYLLRTGVGYWGRDAQKASDMFKPGGPQKFTDYPIVGTMAEQFKLDPYRMSEAEQLYWDKVARSSRGYPVAAADYKALIEKGNLADANAYLGTLADDKRSYALFSTQGDTFTKMLHPINRAAAIMKAASDMNREIAAHDLRDTVGGRITAPIPLAPSKAEEVKTAIRQIAALEMHNTMVFMGDRAMVGKHEMDLAPSVDLLRAASPAAFHELEWRLQRAGVQPWDYIKQQFPVENRVLNDAWQDSVNSGTGVIGQRAPRRQRLESLQ